jgi:glutamine amidotransferase
MIVIVDYGVGNVGSIFNMLRKVGAQAVLASDPAVIRDATKLVLPGIGKFDAVMSAFNGSGLRSAIEEAVLGRSIPVLGICVGMQMMGKGSEEGQEPGLGWVAAHTKRFDFSLAGPSLRLPHTGWNFVKPAKAHGLIGKLPPDPRFYFVHSYHVVCEQPADILLQAHYGLDFTASFASRNILGVQFHPEKSHKYGMQLFRGFAGVEERAREPLSRI